MKTKDLIHRAMMLERSMATAREYRTSNVAYAIHCVENARIHVLSLPIVARATYEKQVDDLAREIAPAGA